MDEILTQGLALFPPINLSLWRDPASAGKKSKIDTWLEKQEAKSKDPYDPEEDFGGG